MSAQEQNHRYSGDRPPAFSGVIGGLVIIAVGVILLLDRNGLINGREVLRYWPLALVAFGVFKLIAPSRSRISGALMVVTGAILSLDPLGFVHLSFRELWPILLILLGVLLLWASIEGRGAACRCIPGGVACGPGYQRDITSADLDEWTVFGGGERTIVTDDFRGGRVSAVFGGWEIDLSHAAMKGNEAAIEVKCVFGGVEIRVPETWDVRVRAVALLGGVSDQTRHPRRDELADAKRLIITGSAILGGIGLKN